MCIFLLLFFFYIRLNTLYISIVIDLRSSPYYDEKYSTDDRHCTPSYTPINDIRNSM